jgi:phospholipid/cholesterol/gamma-HCH transport system substrate-binding protein
MHTRVTGFRYTNEAVGALVLVTVLIFVLALVQAGRLREWFDPGATIKVILPAEGLFGLTQGAQVDLLGTRAGEVRRIVLDPERPMHAEIYVRKTMLAFVRRDSQAIIRKQFGVAGASYLELTRGSGEPLDWEYAVLTATAERAPTDTVSALITEIQSKVIPLIEDAQVAMHTLTALAVGLQDPNGNLQRLLTDLHTMTGRLERGEGAVGRLLNNETLARDLETFLDQTRVDMRRLGPALSAVDTAARNITALTTALNKSSGSLPQLTQRLQATLASLQEVLTDLRRTTPELPRLTKGLANTTESLPLLMVQAEQTLDNLDKLLRQLRTHWLLGDGGRMHSRNRPDAYPRWKSRHESWSCLPAGPPARTVTGHPAAPSHQRLRLPAGAASSCRRRRGVRPHQPRGRHGLRQRSVCPGG